MRFLAKSFYRTINIHMIGNRAIKQMRLIATCFVASVSFLLVLAFMTVSGSWSASGEPPQQEDAHRYGDD